MNIDFSTLADGAVAEVVELELQRILENIADLNTDPKKIRQLKLTLKFKANDKRDIVEVDISTAKITAPIKSVGTTFVMGRDGGGKVAAKELKSGTKGQTYIANDGSVRDDTGNPVTELEVKKDSNVVGFR
ncbi:hypothetical protein [Paenibacillus wynnii]|uniref:Replication terminator protein n=1 Tax=Paenibacillus wynnii TaxID=268407 RepID=A0A098MEV7_9BACL|nr:hypothetical protein [Paenibacillus wynnii]KGE18474.1 hypothetical protein PWYN_03130 [Paenibacillus wynnii]KGE20591.1 hypothetical protein PWYN_15490 [Paenibacillus wynnii]